jgi:phage gp36-like protein
MKKVFFVLLLLLCWFSPVFAARGGTAPGGVPAAGGIAASLTGDTFREVAVSYCTVDDLYESHGRDYVDGWSRGDPAAITKAIDNASSEIDSYLFSGGYAIPLPSAPKSINKYCVDIAAANLVIGRGVLKDGAADQAVLDQAAKAIRFLEKVAKGDFRIPGLTPAGELARPPSGGVLVSAPERLDLRGY